MPTTQVERIVPQTVEDHERGCGYRKAGGIYLRAEGLTSKPCGKLPHKLSICPCCGAGVKHKIGWSWINPKLLFGDKVCASWHATKQDACRTCPLHDLPEKAGLIWVGRAFYETPADFVAEARQLGISRRVHNLPKGFKLGETIVFLAHKDVIKENCGCENQDLCDKCEGDGFVMQPAIFHAFIPNKVEYVCNGKESHKLLRHLVDQGITPVRVRQV